MYLVKVLYQLYLFVYKWLYRYIEFLVSFHSIPVPFQSHSCGFWSHSWGFLQEWEGHCKVLVTWITIYIAIVLFSTHARCQHDELFKSNETPTSGDQVECENPLFFPSPSFPPHHERSNSYYDTWPSPTHDKQLPPSLNGQPPLPTKALLPCVRHFFPI